MDPVFDIRAIILQSEQTHRRTGELVMEFLPYEVRESIVGRVFDLYYMNPSAQEIRDWFADHIIFDNDVIIGVFDNDTILWTKWPDDDPPDMGVPAIVRVS